MFNVGQSPASIFSPICIQIVRNLQLIHSNRINHELYSEPTFPAPQLYLLRHTLNRNASVSMQYILKCWGVWTANMRIAILFANVF